jgi:hypothetical protein
VSKLHAEVQPTGPGVWLGFESGDECVDVGLRRPTGQERLPPPAHLGSIAEVLTGIFAVHSLEISK